MSVVLHFIDILGTFIFALSGAVAGVKKVLMYSASLPLPW
ncbi:Uncharacterised protein [Salmonella enterica subsp. houtenae]|nr:Uncharacterised protein [Salmonella enterica subsp. houtenae]